MSKPYQWLKPANNNRQQLLIHPRTYDGDVVFVADLSGQINLEWAEFFDEHPQDAVLHYCIFSDAYFTSAHIPDSPLKHLLAGKLPPALPGIYVIDLLAKRIRIYIAYGEVFENLSAYLKHPNLEIDSGLNTWHFHEWIMGNKIHSEDVLALTQAKPLAQSSQKKLKNAPWCFGRNFPQASGLIMIIGAGFAGACLARTLAEAGRQVVVLDKEQALGLNGSGNRFSVLYPKLALYDAPLTNLLHQSYPFAFDYYQRFLEQHKALGQNYPLWQQLDEQAERMQGFIAGSSDWFGLETGGILFKRSMVLDMPALCQTLLSHPNISLCLNETVEAFSHDEHGFKVNGIHASDLVLSNSYMANRFKETAFLALKGMRGQMSHVAAVHDEAKIYCHQGHFLPLREGVHAVGASFNPNDLSLDEKKGDHLKNLKPWQTFFDGKVELEVKSAWVGVRGVSLDHLPIVGFVPHEDRFLTEYQTWQHHANLSMDSLMPNIPGLYVFAGFGARGLLTIPYLASYLTSLISKQPFLMPAKLAQALSPARFLKSKLSKSE